MGGNGLDVLAEDGFSDESRQYQLDDAIPEAAEKASVGEMCKLGLIDIDEVAGKCGGALYKAPVCMVLSIDFCGPSSIS